MDKRKIEILNAIINSYINVPNPVGSKAILNELNVKISSATIRNEMSDLEELGYLSKPHTSAGRVPSDKAYRFFVDELQEEFFHSKTDINIDLIKKIFEGVTGFDYLYKNTVKILADTTRCMAFIVALKKPDTKIKSIHLLNIDKFTILLLIVGDRGVVEKQLINVKQSIAEYELREICDKLNEYLAGIDFAEVTRLKVVLKGTIAKYSDFISEVIKRASTFNEKVSEIDLYYDGITNILRFEEFLNVDRTREFISFIENKNLMLDNIGDFNSDFEIIIGSENKEYIMKNNSIIKATFNPKNQQSGQIGIIGPTRMDYKTHMNTVREFRDNLTFALDEIVR